MPKISATQPDGLNTNLVGNQPTKIGNSTCMPADVVLGRDVGITFIPTHLAEGIVKSSEVVRLRDKFSHQRLEEGKFTTG